MSKVVFCKSKFINWDTPENAKIFNSFKTYIKGEALPTLIGRDVPYHRPSDAVFAGLYHIHLGNFNEHTAQFHRTSDNCLVYAKGLIKEAYLAVDILSPDAHKQAESMDLMLKYIEIANQFRNKY